MISHSSWFIDNTTNTTTVTYLLTGADSTLRYSNILYHYSYEACPRSGCHSPPRPVGPVDLKLVVIYMCLLMLIALQVIVVILQ